jgi:hypothetical protein
VWRFFFYADPSLPLPLVAVLGRTDLVTHAVLNVFRRVFIILFTSYYFALPLSMLNACGVALADGGVMGFSYSRYLEAAEKKNDKKPVK